MSVNHSHHAPPLPATGRRAQQKTATRARIRQAALDLFATQRYAATQVADIVRAAGVAQGTFYVHFASKEALLDEVLDEFNADLAARLSRRIAAVQVPSRVGRAHAAADEFLDAWFEHAGFVRAYAERVGQDLDEEALGGGINPPALDLLIGLLAAETGADALTVDLAAHGLLALWFRTAMRALTHPELDGVAVRHTLANMTLGVIGALDTSRGDPQ